MDDVKTTKQQGMITATANKVPTRVAHATPLTSLKDILGKNTIMQQFQNALKDGSGAFATSIVDLYSSDKYLQGCEPGAVIAECLKAATLKLPINKQLGFAYVIPYKDHGVLKPQFQLGYKGYIQLAIRSGFYKHINVDTVYEGEYKGANKTTGEIDVNGEKTGDKAIGYIAHIETLNGFSKTMYWTREAVIKHANQYSKSYKAGSSIWAEHFDEMAQKTVLRNLLSHYGLLSVEMQATMSNELKTDHEDYAEDTAPVEANFTDVIDTTTGEVLPGSTAGTE